ncbi:bifunctional proline dehydrogenase/L-glutamate gamma-semialdehyde dehydrogenase PutA [Litoreibacter roseus]|uniref:Bifunctional protein PutA n=1 Tax=Litoreibacter roseus TaxID=2601869 RepID=A0A6N6JFQ4_9RHOB|nr:bifunctional proline dehydrogenase/L-glutamate gamma-semialdehyde dehydrogenase PutA [Litoreibacter roseus]GFE64209.1 bifunctional protein PutA [Litoreibacter roseus]
MDSLNTLRADIRDIERADEDHVLSMLERHAPYSPEERNAASKRAAELVTSIRADKNPGLMEVFLAEYGLSTDEGIALMCLAEALLRVPDTQTIDALIEDKIAPSAWSSHLGKSSSPLVNASTWALMLTGNVLRDGEGVASTLKAAVKRVGEPVIRAAVSRAMKELGGQFVLGQTIEEALVRGKSNAARGYTYSYDMLGEAALTAEDAQEFYAAYEDAITKLTPHCTSDEIRRNPSISIKLSALHPRYDVPNSARVMNELVPRVKALAKKACNAQMGLNIDAEEADRLDLSLDVIEAVLSDPALAGWDGFGVVVQAYGKRAGHVIRWLHALAERLDRKIMVRLVKGAYWDTEIKRAQVEGIDGFPVFTRKVATDASFLRCARMLLGMTDRIYPQFATHNAHSVAAILEVADDPTSFEFQRLHGMGEALHNRLISGNQAACRIYAPVGPHRDLLAYLVRRLLENGANSSFVNQIVDKSVPAEVVAADPFEALETNGQNIAVCRPADIYAPARENAKGWDLHAQTDLDLIDTQRGKFRSRRWTAEALMVAKAEGGQPKAIKNPALPEDQVGDVVWATSRDVSQAVSDAKPWQATAEERAQILRRASNLYEENFGELFAVLAREAGKTPLDGVAELREAVDFLRYYANRGLELEREARGIFACISPWNFPLAIFTGQIAAALAAGNAVVAKPAEQTPLTACVAVRLLHEAGVPTSALQLLPGLGKTVGAALVSDPRISGVCFTGSTATALSINKAMADNADPTAPLIAETGGLNAMIVDSTALPEQAVADVIASAFQSAGQRCSALRMLYLQRDVADTFLKMLYGAMDELTVGDPWRHATDVGPVIDQSAQSQILDYITDADRAGRVLKDVAAPSTGTYVKPTVIEVSGIADLTREVFGPVLHIAMFEAEELDDVVADINATGYGLTFGIHSRIDDRIEAVTRQLTVGNIYVNRNQIGAVVGSQPFGGEGLSGTGPKAGGPRYVAKFTRSEAEPVSSNSSGQRVAASDVQVAIDRVNVSQARLSETTLPGPTGESNRYATYGRGIVLCLGPSADAAKRQAEIVRERGCHPICIAPGLSGDMSFDGMIDPSDLTDLAEFHAVTFWADTHQMRDVRKALAARDGPILPLLAQGDLAEGCVLERHVCVDTTAAGGNVTLLAASSG